MILNKKMKDRNDFIHAIRYRMLHEEYKLNKRQGITCKTIYAQYKRNTYFLSFPHHICLSKLVY